MATKRQKVRVGKRKATRKRRIKRLPRFHTKAVLTESGQLLVRIFDRKVKKFLRGEWEFGHVIAVLKQILQNPASAYRYGYTD
jgi:hypothetical protein